MMPLPRTRETLTGRSRGRPQLFSRKLVLQVEFLVEIIDGLDAMPPPPPPWCTDVGKWRHEQAQKQEAAWRPLRREWRDATWNDYMATPEGRTQP